MPELVLEIRCQEMSPELARRLLRRLGGRLFEELMSRGISFQELVTGVTPRRVALAVRGLPDAEPEREKVEIGPPAAEAWGEEDEPAESLQAFAVERGVEPAELERRATERGEHAALVTTEPRRPIGQLLELLLRRLFAEISAVEKGFGGGLWPRPVTGLLAILDGEPLDLELDGHAACGETAGHPVLSPDPFEVASFDDYSRGLEERGVVLAPKARLEVLAELLEARAEELGGEPLTPPGLLERWSALCEVPGLVDGDLPGEVLALPRELLVTVLAERQDAVALGRGGEVLPFFIGVMDRGDDPRGAVRAGRRRAVAGDLLDALLTYERDRKTPLVQRVRRLEQLTFHEGLGTFADKGQRLRELVQVTCDELGWDEVAEHALEAAALAKADLTTAAVEAYPELHGVLGGVLARGEGYVEPVWRAIYEHPLPRRDADSIPGGRTGRLLAFADRLGTLVGFFGLASSEGDTVSEIARRPSAEDRHGLRSLATGLLRLIIEGGMDVDLDLLAARAVLLYGDRLEHDAESILRRLQVFLDRRLDHLLGARGFLRDEIEAAKAVGTRSLPDLVARLEGLRDLRGSDELRRLVAAARRVAKIVAEMPESEVDPELLEDGAESALLEALEEVTPRVEEAAAEGDYAEVLRHLSALVAPLERFFAEVLVMDEDERRRLHRVALLQSARRLCWRVARLGALDLPPETPGDAEEKAAWLESGSSTTD